MEQINPHKAIQYIIDTAPLYAQAKSNRVYLEEARKSIKAKLMNSSPETAMYKQESYAYSHPDYLELLQGLRVAVEEEVKLHWLLQAAQARIEVFKTTQYTQRAEIKAMS
jgi:hypothetical protein